MSLLLHKRRDVKYDWGVMVLIHEGGPKWTMDNSNDNKNTTSWHGYGQRQMVMDRGKLVVLISKF